MNTGLYLQCVHQHPGVYDFAAGVVVQMLYDGNELRGEAVITCLQMMSRSTPSNAFWKSTNTEFTGVCHSNNCSMMICSVAMWSVQDLFWQKPVCSSLRVLSRAFLSLSRMILVRILLGMKSSMISHQLLHDDRSPFFGSFIMYPSFHFSGICSFSQIFIRRGWIISGGRTSAFSAPGGMRSGPVALPDFKDLIALRLADLGLGWWIGFHP